MKKEDLIGWCGNVFFIIGAASLSYGNSYGFVFNSIGNFLYIIQAMYTHMFSLIVLSFILVAINVIGFITWH